MKTLGDLVFVVCLAAVMLVGLVASHHKKPKEETVVVPLSVCEHATTAYIVDGKQEHIYHCTWSEMK